MKWTSWMATARHGKLNCDSLPPQPTQMNRASAPTSQESESLPQPKPNPKKDSSLHQLKLSSNLNVLSASSAILHHLFFSEKLDQQLQHL
jgi:hypothetical protein